MPDYTRQASELLQRLGDPSSTPKTQQDTNEELAKVLAQMKLTVQGTQETDSSPEAVTSLIQSIVQTDLLFTLATSIHLLPFESRKDTVSLFSNILRFKPPGSSPQKEAPAMSYVTHTRPEILIELCRGYEHPATAMSCGIILREALRSDHVAAIILYDESKEGEKALRLENASANVKATGEGIFWQFFRWIDQGAFEVSADAFSTFREILTRHKNLVTTYLSTNFAHFFTLYNTTLILSPSYVTKRQSIKLLGELLLDRAHYTIMTTYVSSAPHLKTIMNLLRDDRKMVQYEAFHVFKVFVANPNKSIEVQRILINNRGRLLRFLPRFLEDRVEDEQFMDEKSFLIRQIEMLPPEPVEPAQAR
ncbi:MAG: hypothetical protein M1834_007131 [Cirrosporium novae-zelandiae]|nr:MAG: hypothetical protein M1834_007131 [Cirrosporium novae-zelandiae]